MTKKRVNKYPKAFWRMALQRMRSCDNVSALAHELGVDRTVLYHWRNLMPGEDGTTANSPVRELRKEIRDLKRVLAEKAMELDDTLNRLQTLTPPSTFATGSFGFTYDVLSRRTQMTRPNNIATNYSYDNLSRLLSVSHQVGTSTIDGATYTVDNGGNRTSKLDRLANITSNFACDDIYQLKTVTQGGEHDRKLHI